MSKGTIIYIGGFELPDKNAAAHRVINNAKIFKALDYDVVFIDTCTDKTASENIMETKRCFFGCEVWSVRYPESNRQWIKYLTDITGIIKVMEGYENITTVICYNYQAVALEKLRRFCRRSGIKILADCTEWYSSKNAGVLFWIVKGMDSFVRMRIIQKKLDGIIVISRYLQEYYRNNNIVLVPPLVDLSEPKWQIEKNINKDYIQFIYAGSPNKTKERLDLVVNSIIRVSEKIPVRLLLIGVTKEKFLSMYDYKDATLLDEKQDIISFMGRIDHKSVLGNVANSNYSIIIRDENRVTRAGFPTKFVESISCGTPVIANNNSDLNTYLDGIRNGHCLNMGTFEQELIEVLKENNELIVEKNRFDYQNYIACVNDFLATL